MSSQSPPTSPATADSVQEAMDDDLEWEEWKEWKEWKDWKGRKERREREKGKKRKQMQVEGETTYLDPSLAGKTSEPVSVHGREAAHNLHVVGSTSPASRSTGWSRIYKVFREYDEDTIKGYKEDIDGLLVFAGLFSAVLTAFLIESYPRLLQDTSGASSSALGQQATRMPVCNCLAQDNVFSTAATSSPSTSFRPSATDIRTNVLWFASLLLSLMAASFGILVKQWLRQYMSLWHPSPKARVRIRQLRYPALYRWVVFDIAAFLPILVHLSLALFFIGLTYFASSVHPSVEFTIFPLVVAWSFLFVTSASLPIFIPHCPYHLSILGKPYAYFHRLMEFFSTSAGHYIYRYFYAEIRRNSTPITATGLVLLELRHWWRHWWVFWSSFFSKVSSVYHQTNEVVTAQCERRDLEILSDMDAIQSNDELLKTEIVEAARQVDLEQYLPHATLKFIHSLLYNRLAVPQDDDDNYFSLILNLKDTALSSQARSAIISMVLDFIPKLPHMVIRLDGLPRAIELLKPRFIFALLLCLSEHPLHEIPLLVTHLSQQRRGREVTSLCLIILAQPSSHDHTKHDACKIAEPPDNMRINLLRGISLVHRAVQARWGLTQALRSVGPTTTAYPQFGDDDYTIAPHPPDSLIRAQEYMTSLGSRAMQYVVSLESWTGRLDRHIVNDILRSLCDEVNNRTLRRRSQSSDATPQDPAPGGVLMVDLITLDSLVTYICFQLWRPQWFRLEKCWTCLLPTLISRAESRTLTLAICCVPTTGVLRLCWRAASHSHSSGTQVIRGLDLKALSNFDGVLDNDLRYDLVRNNPMNILKLLSFSLYLYTFSTSRLLDIPKAEKQAWAKIFKKFTTSTQELQLDTHHSRCKQPGCRHRKPWSALATVCLEMIRFEEILARIMRRYVEDLACEQLMIKDYSTFRYTSDRTVNMQVVDGWKSTPLCSVFSEGLITALEKLAEPSWFDPIPNTGHGVEIQFHDYCIAYEERIRDIVKIKVTDTWSWLRGYCSHSPRRR